MNRRHMFTLAPGAALTLAGCGTLSQQQAAQLQAVIAASQGVGASVSAAVPVLIADMGLSGPTAGALIAASQALGKAVTALAAAPNIAAGATYVATIEIELNVLVGVAASLPIIPEPAHSALVAAALALPALEQLVGLAIREGTALADTIKAGRVVPAWPAVVRAQ